MHVGRLVHRRKRRSKRPPAGVVHEGAHWVWSSSPLRGRNPIRIPGSGLFERIPIYLPLLTYLFANHADWKAKSSEQANGYSLAFGQEGIRRAWGMSNPATLDISSPACAASFICMPWAWLVVFQRGPFFKGCPLGTGKVPPCGRLMLRRAQW
jgi:hypothetical protein